MDSSLPNHGAQDGSYRGTSMNEAQTAKAALTAQIADNHCE